MASKVSGNDGDDKPATSRWSGERGDLLGPVGLSAPFVLKVEISPETGSPEFGWELLACGNRRENLGFGHATFSQWLLGMCMQAEPS